MGDVVNLFGGPGVGKSTIAAGVFFRLKSLSVNCELVREYAKDVVWEGRNSLLANQIYVFAKQHKRLTDVVGHVDVVLTDSPLPLSAVYGSHYPACFTDLVWHEFNSFSNLNFVLERRKPYVTSGREQTEEQAAGLDVRIRHVLDANGVPYMRLQGTDSAVDAIVAIYMARVGAMSLPG